MDNFRFVKCPICGWEKNPRMSCFNCGDKASVSSKASSDPALAAAEARIAELERDNKNLRIAALEKALWDIRTTIEGDLDVTIRDLVNGTGNADDLYADRDKIVAYCDAALLKEKE